jgi:hypothetical protein
MSSRSCRNNNPGNIRHHNSKNIVYPVNLILSGKDDGQNYASYPSIAKGCAALAYLLSTKYNDMNIIKAIAQYAPAEDQNDPEQYARVICQWMNLPNNVTIGDLHPNQFFDLCKGITKFEGWIP